MGEIFAKIHEQFSPWLGFETGPRDMTIAQVCLRGIVVFVFALAIVRVADKRFLSRKTAFDAVLSFMLASMLSRSINGSAAIVPTIVAALLLVLTHRLLAHLSCRWHWMGAFIKGTDEEVIRDGKVLDEVMREHNFSYKDLLEDLRLNGLDRPDQVKTARLERNGELSVVRKER